MNRGSGSWGGISTRTEAFSFGTWNSCIGSSSARRAACAAPAEYSTRAPGADRLRTLLCSA